MRAKRLAERALRWGGPAWIGRRLRPGRSLVLAYHNVVPDDALPSGDRSLHLRRSEFAAQLDLLQRRYPVVPLGTLLDGSADRRGPAVAITFDDAYRGALTHGLDELGRRGLPATVFVTPGFVGGRAFWWDSLAGPSGDGLTASFRARALDEWRGDDTCIREAAVREGRKAAELPADLRCVDDAELRRAARYPGITFGAHTWSHPNLTRIGGAELFAELGRPLAWLRERFTNTAPWIAYPYGLSTAPVETAARAAGYEAGLLVTGGWLRGTPSRFAWPRYNVPAGLSLAGFDLRLAGLGCR